jgi:prepilin-type N-terminal cleavage/methylation domain-containing protein
LFDARKNSGFTLIELILVMVLAGILIVVATARWPGTEITLQSSVDQLAADLDLARSLAISRGKSITIQSTADSYTITDSANTVLYPASRLAGVAMDSFTIVFDRYGNPGPTDTSIGLAINGTRMSLTIVSESGVVLQ